MLQSTGFDLTAVPVAVLAHYAVGIAGGLVFAAVSAPLRLDATLALAVLAGAGFGLVLYLFNFYGMVNLFPWFAEVRSWTTLLINLIFGISTAALYWKLARRGEARRELQEAT
jgi:ABC-type Fe3+-siderophore transport system permease subunit